MTRRKTEFIYRHTHKHIIHIVSWPSSPGKGFGNSHNNNIKQQSNQEVRKQLWPVKCVKTKDSKSQPRNTMTRYLKKLVVMSIVLQRKFIFNRIKKIFRQFY